MTDSLPLEEVFADVLAEHRYSLSMARCACGDTRHGVEHRIHVAEQLAARFPKESR